MINEDCTLSVLNMTNKVEDEVRAFAGKQHRYDDIMPVILKITRKT